MAKYCIENYQTRLAAIIITVEEDNFVPDGDIDVIDLKTIFN